jgi:tubulin-like protein CetZ
MKLVVVGLGQCGNRVADEFARLNQRAMARRGTEIITGSFAVNSDAADLTGLRTIKADYKHRILIGGRRTSGHGVGKLNEVGAEIARQDSDKVLESIRQTEHSHETDAYLMVAGAGGGTGSGALPIMAKVIKERYPDKPVYALLVLPFEHEENSEERTVYNAAVCMKSVSAIADAVILFDNQRYIQKDYSLRTNLSRINELIAAPFYSLLCAGEEVKGKYIGAKVVDAGDIIQTLTGWTVIGFGKSDLSMWRMPWQGRNFKAKGMDTYKGIQAMDEAIADMSIKCRPSDAARAMYLLAAPEYEMNMDLVKELGKYLKELAPRAIIRNGDYPHKRGMLDVTILLSGLSDVEKVRDYYSRSIKFMDQTEKRKEESQVKLDFLTDVGKDVPSLL